MVQGYPEQHRAAVHGGLLFIAWLATATWNIVTLPAVFVGLLSVARYPGQLVHISPLAVPGITLLWVAVRLTRRGQARPGL
jgi:hypothetical protein